MGVSTILALLASNPAALAALAAAGGVAGTKAVEAIGGGVKDHGGGLAGFGKLLGDLLGMDGQLGVQGAKKAAGAVAATVPAALAAKGVPPAVLGRLNPAGVAQAVEAELLKYIGDFNNDGRVNKADITDFMRERKHENKRMFGDLPLAAGQSVRWIEGLVEIIVTTNQAEGPWTFSQEEAPSAFKAGKWRLSKVVESPGGPEVVQVAGYPDQLIQSEAGKIVFPHNFTLKAIECVNETCDTGADEGGLALTIGVFDPAGHNPYVAPQVLSAQSDKVGTLVRETMAIPVRNGVTMGRLYCGVPSFSMKFDGNYYPRAYAVYKLRFQQSNRLED